MKERLDDRQGFQSLEDRIDLYVYLRQYGLWPEFVLGKENLEAEAKTYSPTFHLTARYPRTVLIHGMSDNDVPVQTSKDMAAALEEKELPHKLILLDGQDHDLLARLEEGEE